MTGYISDETKARDELCRVGRALWQRGLAPGSSGNLSVRLDDGRLLVTPTNSCMGELDPLGLSVIASDGAALAGAAPTKEAFLHSCIYCARPDARAVVHVHSTHAVAISVLAETNPQNALPKLTAYYGLRVGALPMVPYFAPGDRNLAKAVAKVAETHHAVLLANHGSVVGGKSLRDAQYIAEEIEETAKIALLTAGRAVRLVDG